MAAALGTGPMADAFNAAFQFPNTFPPAVRRRRLQRRLRAAVCQGDRGARHRRRQALFGGSVRRAVLGAAGADHRHGTGDAADRALPSWRRASPTTPDKFELTVALATIMFPYLICMSLGAMMSGMLNSLRRYFAAAMAPVFLNIILIGVLGLCLVQGPGRLMPSATAWPGACWRPASCSWPSSGCAVRHAGISIGFRRPRMTPQRQAAAGPGASRRRSPAASPRSTS